MEQPGLPSRGPNCCLRHNQTGQEAFARLSPPVNRTAAVGEQDSYRYWSRYLFESFFFGHRLALSSMTLSRDSGAVVKQNDVMITSQKTPAPYHAPMMYLCV